MRIAPIEFLSVPSLEVSFCASEGSPSIHAPLVLRSSSRSRAPRPRSRTSTTSSSPSPGSFAARDGWIFINVHESLVFHESLIKFNEFHITYEKKRRYWEGNSTTGPLQLHCLTPSHHDRREPAHPGAAVHPRAGQVLRGPGRRPPALEGRDPGACATGTRLRAPTQGRAPGDGLFT